MKQANDEGRFLVNLKANRESIPGKLLFYIKSPFKQQFHDAWKEMWRFLPHSRYDEYHVFGSSRVNRVKGFLEGSKSGLLLVDLARFKNAVRLRQILVAGSTHQTLPDRGMCDLSLVIGDSVKDAKKLMQQIQSQLKLLAEPETVGRALEICEILNHHPLTSWGMIEYLLVTNRYFAKWGVPNQWTGGEKTKKENLAEAVRKLEEFLEEVRAGDAKEIQAYLQLEDEINKEYGMPKLLELRKTPFQGFNF